MLEASIKMSRASVTELPFPCHSFWLLMKPVHIVLGGAGVPHVPSCTPNCPGSLLRPSTVAAGNSEEEEEEEEEKEGCSYPGLPWGSTVSLDTRVMRLQLDRGQP